MGRGMEVDLSEPIKVLGEQAGWIRSVAWSPNGRYLASASEYDMVWVWDTWDWKLIRVLKGGRYAYPVAWSPNGLLLANASKDMVRVWDTRDWRLIKMLKGPGGISSVSWSPDGRYLVGDEYIWDRETWELLRVIDTEGDPVYQVVWSPDGRYLAVLIGEYIVRVLDAGAWEVAGVIEGRSVIDAIAWSPDSRYIALSVGGEITIWDIKSWGVIKDIRGDSSSLAWSPYGRFLACSDFDGVIKLWDTLTWELVGESPRHCYLEEDAGMVEEICFMARSIAWRPDGCFLAAGFDDGYVRVWVIRFGGL